MGTLCDLAQREAQGPLPCPSALTATVQEQREVLGAPAPLPGRPPPWRCQQIEQHCLENSAFQDLAYYLPSSLYWRSSSQNRSVFLPPNMPVDQGVTAAFKAYYLRTRFAQAIAAAAEGTDAILEKLYLQLLLEPFLGLGDATKEGMNGTCRKTLKQFVHDSKDLPRVRRVQESTGCG